MFSSHFWKQNQTKVPEKCIEQDDIIKICQKKLRNPYTMNLIAATTISE